MSFADDTLLSIAQKTWNACSKLMFVRQISSFYFYHLLGTAKVHLSKEANP